MIIPEQYRTSEQLDPQPQIYEELEAMILKRITDHPIGYIPLNNITVRYNGMSQRFDTSVAKILSKLQRDGSIGIRTFPVLNRTYVFSGTYYSMLLDEYHANGETVWEDFEAARLAEKPKRKSRAKKAKK